MKKKSNKIYERRRTIASIYMYGSMFIGLPLAIAGSGLDSNKYNPFLYWTGLFLASSGLILLSIFTKILNEIQKEKKEDEYNRRNY